MAYCRWSKTCRVYMYSHVFGGYQFHLAGKIRSGQRDFNMPTLALALRKMKRLQTQGFGVPQYAIDRLEQEYHEEDQSRKVRSPAC